MRAMILYRDRRWIGGVVVFIELLRNRLGDDWSTEQYQIGLRFGKHSRFATLLAPLRDALGLFRAVSSSKPDVVHINPSLNVVSLLRDGLFLLVLRLLDKRGVLVFWHGWEAGLAFCIRNNAICRFLFRWLFGWAHHSVVLASSFRNDLLAMGFPSEKVSVESTMFDGNLFKGISRKPQDCVTLLFLSRMEKTKGVFELVEAFGRLGSRYPNARLVMGGDGPARKELEMRVAKLRLRHVCFLGYVRGVEKAQALVDADIFVLPTYYPEGCPVALLEAMGVGLPCITSAVGGIPDVFHNGINGILLNAVTVDTVADALEQLLSNPTLRARIADHNRVEAWNKYEASVVTPRIEARYRQVAGLDPLL